MDHHQELPQINRMAHPLGELIVSTQHKRNSRPTRRGERHETVNSSNHSSNDISNHNSRPTLTLTRLGERHETVNINHHSSSNDNRSSSSNNSNHSSRPP